MKQELKDFVIEKYNKIKKAKKVSPKKLWVYVASNGYTIDAENLKTKDNAGNLYDLYQTIAFFPTTNDPSPVVEETKVKGAGIDVITEEKQVKSNEKIIGFFKGKPIFKSAIIPEQYISSNISNFQLKWIPFIKKSLQVIYDSEEFIYENMEDEFQQLISKEDFECLVSYTKI